MSHLKKNKKKNLINPPPFVIDQLQYECIMGSNAYGVTSENSDLDIYGFCIPPKYYIFDYSFINGFDLEKNNFSQYQQHHIKNADSKIEYDFTIYNITKYFRLCMNGNPNIIDSLFVPLRCITYSTELANYVRENRKLFLSKKMWHTFKGYSYAQVHKMKTKSPEEGSTRYEMVQKYGYDLKFAYHVVRLLNEVEQILIEQDLDLERNREQLKSIRNGEWNQEQIINYFETKERELEKIYLESKLQHSPNIDNIKRLLLQCLEMHYGSISDAIKTNVPVEKILDDMEQYIQNLRKMI